MTFWERFKAEVTAYNQYVDATEHPEAFEPWLVRKLMEAESKLETLQDAISPSRKGMVNDDYYVKVVRKMQERETKIKPLAQIEAPDASESSLADKQRKIDISNLRFYAHMFREHHWSTVVIHWTVFDQTLREIADRIEQQQPAQPTEIAPHPRHVDVFVEGEKVDERKHPRTGIVKATVREAIDAAMQDQQNKVLE